ncbi:hypothetical protein VCR14J2_300585 [Vibrio coralliirubri]|nr:hypothetical protein VCR14J2_300585 [Vibrio coralliirubri]
MTVITVSYGEHKRYSKGMHPVEL